MKLKSIKISNFKGIKDLFLEFDENTNEICGMNGSGKSSIKDAYFWCLGQDIKNIIPSKDNVEIPNLEIAVELKMKIDDVEFTLLRNQKEKYKVDKETGNKVKTGNESKYYIDGIEQKVAEYKEKLANMLHLEDYNAFTLLSDLEFFNGTSNSWKWNNRRIELLKHINYDNSTILEKEEYQIIKEDILKGYPLDELKKSYKKANNDLDKQKEKNVIIVEQLESQLVDTNIDTKSYEATIEGLEKEKAQYYDSLKESKEILNDYNKFKNQLSNIESKEKMLMGNLDYKKKSARNELNRLLAQIDNLSTSTEKKVCPYCNSELQDNNLNALLTKLNDEKNKLINSTKAELDGIKSELEKVQEEKENCEMELSIIKEEFNLEEIANKLNDDTFIQEANNKIMSLKSCMLKANQSLKDKEQIETLNKENLELTSKSIVYVNKLNALNNYNVQMSKDITKLVNDLFPSEVSFALFDYANYKGDLEDICLSMLNGKTYDECSTGEKYYLNFLIVTTLQKIYGVELPLWCDNYECLSRNLESSNQVVMLSVSAINDNNINKIIKMGE